MSEVFRWFYTPFFWFVDSIDLYGQTAAKGDFAGYGGGLGILFMGYNFLLVAIILAVIEAIREISYRRR
jgi:hypothetical protein